MDTGRNEEHEQNELSQEHLSEDNDKINFDKNDNNEEFATEVASWGTSDGFKNNSAAEAKEEREDRHWATEHEEMENDTGTTRVFGWIALITAIASFLIWPAVLGSIGFILGIIAFFNGQRALGGWSMAIGAIAFISFLFLVPLYS